MRLRLEPLLLSANNWWFLPVILKKKTVNATICLLYVNADLTLAEIEHGRTTYDELLEWGKSEGIIIEEKDDEMSLEG